MVGKMCEMSGGQATQFGALRLGTPNLGVRLDCFLAKKSPGLAWTYKALNSTLCPMVFHTTLP